MSEDNVQDIAVEDKDLPSLAATKEAQDVSRLNKIIIPMPSFTNPNNPATAAGSINLDLDEHPVEHSPDYGGGVRPGRDKVLSVADTHAKEMADAAAEAGPPGRTEAAASTPAVEYPESRDDWQKKHWQAKAREMGLAVSGNADAVQERVEEQESYVEEAKTWKAQDWIGAVEDAETTDDLTELRGLYDGSGAKFSTAEDAFTKRQTELNDEQ